MNFYALAGTRPKQSVLALTVDDDAQKKLSSITRPKQSVLALTVDDDAQKKLSSIFAPLVNQIRTGEQVAFDPGYRPEEGEITAIAPYALPAALSSLLSAADAAVLPKLTAKDIETTGVRAIAAVDWEGREPAFVAFQRVESPHVLKRERWRLMLAEDRLVLDNRPGLAITEQVDAVFEGKTLYITSWPRAHSILDLSKWIREATVSEMNAFFRHKKLAVAKDFDAKAVADTVVRRKIASISLSKMLEKCSVQSLRQYASKFGMSLEVSGRAKIVLPTQKKELKAFLSLLDEDFLSFEPTAEYWVVNSKRRFTS